MESEKANSNHMRKEIDQLKALLSEIEQTLKEITKDLALEHEKMKTFEQRAVKAREKIKELCSKHAWIESEKQFFGKPDTPYCFKNVTDQALDE